MAAPTARTSAASSTLGVLGGGQLGRMFAQAAQRLGFDVVVLDPQADAPAAQVAPDPVVAAYDDPTGLEALAQRVLACTTEFESVPAASLAALARRVPVSPSADALAICQHRAREKALFERVGVPCVPHARIESADDVVQAQGRGWFPALLKTSTLGYDGKGQRGVASPQDLPAAWSALDRLPCLLEQKVDLALEFSLIVARARSGERVALPAQQNLHRDGILAVTQVPAPDLPAEAADRATRHALALVEAMDYVGVLCVEFFLLRDGRVLANEMAPRPHNSGHYSIDACDHSQFDLQVRALADLPLVQPRLHSHAVMLNLLGDLWFPADGSGPREPPWAEVLALPGAHLHRYGKREARPGRKMGHLTLTAPDAAQVRALASTAARRLGLADPFPSAS